MRKAHSLLCTGFSEALAVEGSVPYLGSEFSKEIGALPHPITGPQQDHCRDAHTASYASCSPPALFQQKLS